jgi:NAD+ diphosphatase
MLRIRDGQLLPFRATDGPLDLVPVTGELGPGHVYLGRADGDAVFAARATEGDGYPEPAGGWLHPFSAHPLMTPLQLELMTVALATVSWNASMPFSPRDGGATTSVQGGWARLDEHGGEHFPRTDPAVIVLVEHDDRLLLGSNVLWESGRFSLLAGFVEAGESAEQAVVREVLEESGVRVEDVRYVGSQPWPFPRSLMLGFRARLAEGADPDELVRDESEISELRWFTRDELRTPSADLKLPMGLSIARWLIDLWVDEGGPAGV